MTLATKRLLAGRRIVDVDLGAWVDEDGEGRRIYDPVITLDNGARIVFTVQETEAGAYGIEPTYLPKQPRPKAVRRGR